MEATQQEARQSIFRERVALRVVRFFGLFVVVLTTRCIARE
jgi:hypothetical protein